MFSDWQQWVYFTFCFIQMLRIHAFDFIYWNIYFTYSDFIWIQEVWMDGIPLVGFHSWRQTCVLHNMHLADLCYFMVNFIFWIKSNMRWVWDRIYNLCCLLIFIYMFISCKAVVLWMFQRVLYTFIVSSLCVLQFSLCSNEDKSVSPVILIFQSIYTWLL